MKTIKTIAAISAFVGFTIIYGTVGAIDRGAEMNQTGLQMLLGLILMAAGVGVVYLCERDTPAYQRKNKKKGSRKHV